MKTIPVNVTRHVNSSNRWRSYKNCYTSLRYELSAVAAAEAVVLLVVVVVVGTAGHCYLRRDFLSR
jgi:hypothetical protein